MLTRRSLLIAAACTPLGACARSIILSGEPRGLRVATFNIWHDAGNWSARLPLLVEALRRADPDVIALQEVLEDKAKNLPNQADTLARALGGYSTRFASTSPEGASRRYGNAVLTRLPIIETSSVALEPTNDFRTALRVRVDRDGSPADMVCTHLAWQAEAGAVRARQVEHLLSWLPADGVPLVLMGDFNATLDDPGLAGLRSARFASALPPGTAATTLNTARKHAPRVIDHIFVETDDFAVESAWVIGDQEIAGEYPSDHFGVAARLFAR